jgi:hypothetical protein
MLAKLFSMLEYSTTPLDTNPFTEQIVGEWSLPDEVCFVYAHILLSTSSIFAARKI